MNKFEEERALKLLQKIRNAIHRDPCGALTLVDDDWNEFLELTDKPEAIDYTTWKEHVAGTHHDD